MNILGSLTASWASKAFGTLSPLLTSTAPVWTFTVVRNLWHVSLAVAGIVTLLLTVLSTERQMSEAESLWRAVALPLLSSVLGMFLSLRLCILLVRLNNGLIVALGRGAVSAALPVPLGTQIEDDLLFWLPYIVLLVVLAIVYLIRAAELMFLMTISPLGMVAMAWPMTRSVGGRYFRELVVVVFVQAAQALLLILSRGLSGLLGPSTPQNGLIGLVVLILLIRAPAYLRRWVSAGSEPSSLGLLAWRFMSF